MRAGSQDADHSARLARFAIDAVDFVSGVGIVDDCSNDGIQIGLHSAAWFTPLPVIIFS